MSNQSQTVVLGYRKPCGYSQILNATLSAAAGIVLPTSLPAGSVPQMAIIQAQSGSVRWRDDGTDPTASIGMTIASGGELVYYGDLSKIKFISASSSPILDISLYA